jgi:hypothetical protein
MDLKEIAGGLQLGFIWHSIGYAVWLLYAG